MSVSAGYSVCRTITASQHNQEEHYAYMRYVALAVQEAHKAGKQFCWRDGQKLPAQKKVLAIKKWDKKYAEYCTK